MSIEWQFWVHEYRATKTLFKIRQSKIVLKQTLTSKLGVTLVLVVTPIYVFVNLRRVTAVPPKQKPYNFTTNTLKAYLSTQDSTSSALVISMTHISGQKPRGRQLSKSKRAIFRRLSLFRPERSTTISRKYSSSFQHEIDAYHSAELYNHSAFS